jgi:hypothetical protein
MLAGSERMKPTLDCGFLDVFGVVGFRLGALDLVDAFFGAFDFEVADVAALPPKSLRAR